MTIGGSKLPASSHFEAQRSDIKHQIEDASIETTVLKDTHEDHNTSTTAAGILVHSVGVGVEKDTVKSVSQREGNQTLLLQMQSKENSDSNNYYLRKEGGSGTDLKYSRAASNMSHKQ